MSIDPLKPKDREILDAKSRLFKIYDKMNKLINALNKHDLPDSLATSINIDVASLNNFEGSDSKLMKALYKIYNKTVQTVKKEMNLVPPGFYQTMWMSLGMGAFGVPFGVAFGAAMGNMGLLAIGIPIGMAIGIALGRGMDEKARKEGRQLDMG